MFFKCSNLADLNLSGFDTSQVTNMSYMFYHSSNLISLDLSSFDTQKVTTMANMFACCNNLISLDLSKFDVDKVTDMTSIFPKYTNEKLQTIRTPYNLKLSVELPAGTWYKDDGTELTELPQNLDHSILIKKDEVPICSVLKATKTKTIYACGDTINIDDLTVLYYDDDGITKELKAGDYTTNANKIDMSTEGVKTFVITYGELTTTIELIVIDEESDVIARGEYKENGNDITWVIDADGKLTVTGTGDFGYQPWSNYRESIVSAEANVSGTTNAAYMFYDCSNLADLDLKNFDTSNVSNMADMFYGCNNLTSLDLKNFDTSNVSNMFNMFSHCSSLTKLDLDNFDTSNVLNMENMFFECSSLTKLDLDNFDTSNVSDMAYMFYGCSNLTSLDLSKFDTSKVTNMEWMFCNCSNLTELDLSSFNTSQVTDMTVMFAGCSNLISLDLSKFDVSKVANVDSMFSNNYTTLQILD